MRRARRRPGDFSNALAATVLLLCIGSRCLADEISLPAGLMTSPAVAKADARLCGVSFGPTTSSDYALPDFDRAMALGASRRYEAAVPLGRRSV